MSTNTYYTLIGSLPALPARFDQTDRVPITELRLRERASMLEPEDRETVRLVFDFLRWDRQDLDRTDEDVCAHYEELMTQLTNPVIREAVTVRTDLRTLISALRRRRNGEEPPIGVGQWVSHIRRNWKHPDFRLGSRYPWLPELSQLLNGPTPFRIENRILDILWEQWSRIAERQAPFSFATLLLYLFRLEVIYRWTSRDAEVGHQKFEQLVSEAMGEYDRLYE